MQTSDSTPSPDSTREPFSLAPLLTTLWGYRRPAAAALLAVMVLYAIYALSATLRSPVERVATIGFRVLFDGAELGEYPNGDPFSASDVISTAVVTKVHEDNDLGRYLSVGELERSLAVTQSSPELTILTRSFESRLANPSLSQVARTEIEAEFKERREAMRVPEYALQFLQHTRAQMIPDALLQKTLLDVLSTWEDVSRTRRGVQTYDIEILRGEFVNDEFTREAPIAITLDLLRRRVDQLIRQADTLATIPGVHALTSTTDKRTSSEVRAALEDLRGLDLQANLARALQTAPADEAGEVEIYMRARLREVERKLLEQRSHLTRFEDTLRMFSADAIPTAPAATGARAVPQGGQDAPSVQLTESFLTTLMAMSRRQEDFEYRRSLAARAFEINNQVARLAGEEAFYRTALEDLNRTGGRRVAAVSADQLDAIRARIKSLLDNQYELYQQISALHLDRGQLYRVVVGYSSAAHRGVLMNNLIYGGLSVLLLSLILIPLACLAHYTFWVRRRQDGSVA